MQNAEGGPLFEFRFRLRTLLYTVTAASLILTFLPLFATRFGLQGLSLAFIAFSAGLSGMAVWLASRDSPRYLGFLIICHIAIAAFLLTGPILSYHINGRAWYDYGLSGWNPPPFHHDDGRIGIVDYDPVYTRPAVWPVIGPIMYIMCWLSVGLMICPPTAPVVSVSLLVLAIRLRHVLTTGQSILAWTLWALGLIPVLYLIVWGTRVLEWIAD